MSESSQSLPLVNSTTSANDEVFSVQTRDAAMKVISISEARKEFSKDGMKSQNVVAFCRGILGSIGIELGGSYAEHGSRLITLRAMAAAANNDHGHEDKKSA